MGKRLLRIHLSNGSGIDFTSENTFEESVKDILDGTYFRLGNIVFNPLNIVAIEDVTERKDKEDDTIKGIPVQIGGGNKICS